MLCTVYNNILDTVHGTVHSCCKIDTVHVAHGTVIYELHTVRKIQCRKLLFMQRIPFNSNLRTSTCPDATISAHLRTSTVDQIEYSSDNTGLFHSAWSV